MSWVLILTVFPFLIVLECFHPHCRATTDTNPSHPTTIYSFWHSFLRHNQEILLTIVRPDSQLRSELIFDGLINISCFWWGGHLITEQYCAHALHCTPFGLTRKTRKIKLLEISKQRIEKPTPTIDAENSKSDSKTDLQVFVLCTTDKFCFLISALKSLPSFDHFPWTCVR